MYNIYSLKLYGVISFLHFHIIQSKMLLVLQLPGEI